MFNKMCKICYDAKRPGFNTHWMKDSSGNVLCPYLANLKCQLCGYSGHTQKYCKMPSKKIRAEPTLNKPSIKIEKIFNSNISKKPQNIFSLLCEDSDNEYYDDEEIKNKGFKVVINNENSSPKNKLVITDEEYFASPIIWGKGREIMIGRRWADVEGA